MELTLRFEGTRVEGEGADVVGPFTFAGRVEEQGRIVMVKQYAGAHSVRYEGEYDGEGTIFGNWFIPNFDSGPFALTWRA